MPDPTLPPEPDDDLAAAVAALTEADIPPAGEWFAVPDPDTCCPAEYAGLCSAELEELIAAGPEPVPDIGPAGAIPRDRAGGGLPGGVPLAGFGQDGVLDLAAPGVALAGFADDAHHQLAALSDDELVGVLRAWRRQTSWAQARELAAIGELARRRPADHTPPAAGPGQFPAKLSEFTAAEVGLALTLTRVAAAGQVALALALADRPATAAALEAGHIDLYKARIILEAVTLLSAEHAAAVETAVLPGAEGQTSGQLRAAVNRAVLLQDPGAMRRRREEAQRAARVEYWTDNEGTATLTGRWLPPAEVLAADKRLCQVAAWWKKQIRAAWKHADPEGVLPRPEHGTDLLRARAYLALLLGQPVDHPPADLLPPSAPDPDTPGSPAQAPGSGGSPSPNGQRPPAGTPGADRGTHPDGAAGPDSGHGSHSPAGPDATGGGTGPTTRAPPP